MDTPAKSRHGAGNWAARGLVAAGRGIALAGLTLAAIGLWAALLTEVAFIHVTSPRTAWLAVPLGLATGALGLWAGPRLLRGYGTLAHSMLAPAPRAEPARRAPA